MLEVERGRGHADDLLRGRQVDVLSGQDRHLTTTLVMGTIRWQIRLDAAYRPLLAKPNARLEPEVEIALRLAAFQLMFLDRIPAHAAIGESVELTKLAGHPFAAGMVNAVLRKVAVLAKPSSELAGALSVAGLSEASAMPFWMVERWERCYGIDITRELCRHGQQQAELSIRLSSAESDAELEAAGLRLEPGAVLTASRRVMSGDITGRAGAAEDSRLWIQDEGSQLVAELAGFPEPVSGKVLDCCAAPGGKTLILAERNPEAQIRALEIQPVRLAAMRRRFDELKVSMPGITERIELKLGDAAQMEDGARYRLVLTDVPCSGTGTLGRNPEIRHRLRPEDLSRFHAQQCGILHGALRAASDADSALGAGRVFYSTCSLEPEENADVVAEVLAGSPGWKLVSLGTRIQELHFQERLTDAGRDALLASLSNDGTLSLLPGSRGLSVSMDGFFVAMLEKSA